ncbi:MAG: CocE/NonD family hydrolase, partial [Bacteroidota bacterium]
MWGQSYLGWAQYMTAAQQPAALKCIIPEVMGFDLYTTGF